MAEHDIPGVPPPPPKRHVIPLPPVSRDSAAVSSEPSPRADVPPPALAMPAPPPADERTVEHVFHNPVSFQRQVREVAPEGSGLVWKLAFFLMTMGGFGYWQWRDSPHFRGWIAAAVPALKPAAEALNAPAHAAPPPPPQAGAAEPAKEIPTQPGGATGVEQMTQSLVVDAAKARTEAMLADIKARAAADASLPPLPDGPVKLSDIPPLARDFLPDAAERIVDLARRAEDQVLKPLAASTEKLKEMYLRALATDHTAAVKAGDAEANGVISQERARVQAGAPAPDGPPHPRLARLRNIWDTEMARLCAPHSEAAARLAADAERLLNAQEQKAIDEKRERAAQAAAAMRVALVKPLRAVATATPAQPPAPALAPAPPK